MISKDLLEILDMEIPEILEFLRVVQDVSGWFMDVLYLIQ